MIVSSVFIAPIKHLTVLFALGLAAGLYYIVRGLTLVARKHKQKAPLSKIAHALQGLVEVNGLATGPNTVTAPITGESCYVYRITVWQQCKAASHEWEKIADETLHVPFFLDDSTGQLLIEPLGADLDLQSEFHKEFDPSLFLEQNFFEQGMGEQNKIPPSVRAFLTRHRIAPARRIRIEECCIRPENAIFVVGTVTENPGVELRPISRGSQDERPGEAEVIRLSVSAQLPATDAMTQQSRISAALIKAGIRNPSAWEAAGVPYCETDPAADSGTRDARDHSGGGNLGTEAEPQSEPRVTPALVLMKGPEDAPFLISWRSQRERGTESIWRSAVPLIGGTFLTLAGLYGLLMRLHLL